MVCGRVSDSPAISQCVCVRRPAHGLGRVVDQDVKRAVGADRIGQGDEPDAAGAGRPRRCPAGQATVDCQGTAAKRRAASWGKRVVIVVRAPSRNRRSAMCMPILARPPVSSARRPLRSGPRGPALVVQVGTVGTELVVEGIDLRVQRLALVAGPCPLQCSRLPAGRRHEREAAGLIVDATRGRGGGRLKHRTVGRRDGSSAVRPTARLDRFEDGGRRLPHGDRVGVVNRDVVELGEHRQTRRELVGIDLHRPPFCRSHGQGPVPPA